MRAALQGALAQHAAQRETPHKMTQKTAKCVGSEDGSPVTCRTLVASKRALVASKGALAASRRAAVASRRAAVASRVVVPSSNVGARIARHEEPLRF